MKTKMTKIMIATLAIVIVVAVGMVILSNPSTGTGTNNGIPGTSYKAAMGKITMASALPESRVSVSLYRVTPRDNDIIMLYVKQVARTRPSVISEKDAPAAAIKILDNYGGLPKDAVLRSSETSYIKRFNRTTQQDEIVSPVDTDVWYRRQLDGMPVLWGGYIEVTLGEKGELLELRKVWRTVEPAGTVRVIPASVAFEKLLQGNDLDRTKGPFDVAINRIRLGYYENPNNVSQAYIEPVWFFQGSMQGNSNITFSVYARQFANFTQTPATTAKSVSGKSVQQKDPFTATFTDTSDANPTKWQWDFGDGTTSSEKNPMHKYNTAGTYNVTLTVWNDLGSDTTTQKYTVDAAPVKKADVNVTVKSSDTPVGLNETITTTSPTLSTIVIAGNVIANTTVTTLPITTIPSATITVNA
jgi:PKD domain